jgi:hypothetical protein
MTGGFDGGFADVAGVSDGPGGVVDGARVPPVDSAVAAVCGNGKLEPGEECDPPGTCPTACPSIGCTHFSLQGSAAACTARCVQTTTKSACMNNDGCCPSGCNAANDSDCSIVCGNGVIEGKETCDPLSSCPTSCPAQGCQLRKLINAGTCTATCVNDVKQTQCLPGDGCCPAGCNNNSDADCPASCGNGVVEAGEKCDPVSSCLSKQSACVSDKDTVRTGSGDPSKCTFACTETPRACGPSDGQCPTNCAAGADPDCGKANGAPCTLGGECKTGACVDSVCCDHACTSSCYACSRSRTNQSDGTCAPVKTGADAAGACPKDNAGCGNDGNCNGSGSCEQWGSSHVCQPAMCSNGVAFPAGTCQGGNCAVGNSMTCAPYACGGSTCKKSCGSDADCAAADYCYLPGSDCELRCQNKSVTNAIPNPSFNGGLVSWSSPQNVDASANAAKDATGCSTSTAAQIDAGHGGYLLSDCFVLPFPTPSSFNFGYMANADGPTNGSDFCDVRWYNATDCDVGSGHYQGGTNMNLGFSQGWTKRSAIVHPTLDINNPPDPNFIRSAQIECVASSTTIYVDQFFLNSNTSAGF